MDTYEYPLGIVFKASTPEHAAARVFGGKPADYIATSHTYVGVDIGWDSWIEVSRADTGEFVGDIPVIHTW